MVEIIPLTAFACGLIIGCCVTLMLVLFFMTLLERRQRLVNPPKSSNGEDQSEFEGQRFSTAKPAVVFIDIHSPVTNLNNSTTKSQCSKKNNYDTCVKKFQANAEKEHRCHENQISCDYIEMDNIRPDALDAEQQRLLALQSSANAKSCENECNSDEYVEIAIIQREEKEEINRNPSPRTAIFQSSSGNKKEEPHYKSPRTIHNATFENSDYSLSDGGCRKSNNIMNSIKKNEASVSTSF